MFIPLFHSFLLWFSTPTQNNNMMYYSRVPLLFQQVWVLQLIHIHCKMSHVASLQSSQHSMVSNGKGTPPFDTFSISSPIISFIYFSTDSFTQRLLWGSITTAFPKSHHSSLLEGQMGH